MTVPPVALKASPVDWLGARLSTLNPVAEIPSAESDVPSLTLNLIWTLEDWALLIYCWESHTRVCSDAAPNVAAEDHPVFVPVM